MNFQDPVKSRHGRNGHLLLKLDPKRTCLLVIDMQKGFADKTGFVARQGLDIEGVRSAIPIIKQAVKYCHKKGIPVFYTQQIHVSEAFNEKGLHKLHQFVGRDLVQASKSEGYRLARRGTSDIEFLSEVKPSKNDYIIPKNKPSAFFQTMFEVYLKYLDIKTILVTGCNTGYCVVSTLTDAWARDYDTITIEDAVGDPDTALTRSLLDFFDRRFGRVLSFNTVKKVLNGYPRAVNVREYYSSSGEGGQLGLTETN
jgi:nicotinamidase-related amidase